MGIESTVAVIMLAAGSVFAIVFFSLKKIKKLQCCGATCEQVVSENDSDTRYDRQLQIATQLAEQSLQALKKATPRQQENMDRHAKPVALWNNLFIPEEHKISRSSSNKLMPALQLEQRDL